MNTVLTRWSGITATASLLTPDMISPRNRPARTHSLSSGAVKRRRIHNWVNRVSTVGNTDKSPLQEERGYLIYSGNIASRGGWPQPT